MLTDLGSGLDDPVHTDDGGPGHLGHAALVDVLLIDHGDVHAVGGVVERRALLV